MFSDTHVSAFPAYVPALFVPLSEAAEMRLKEQPVSVLIHSTITDIEWNRRMQNEQDRRMNGKRKSPAGLLS